MLVFFNSNVRRGPRQQAAWWPSAGAFYWSPAWCAFASLATTMALIHYKKSSYQYIKPHSGDKTVVRSSYPTIGFPILIRWRLYIKPTPSIIHSTLYSQYIETERKWQPFCKIHLFYIISHKILPIFSQGSNRSLVNFVSDTSATDHNLDRWCHLSGLRCLCILLEIPSVVLLLYVKDRRMIGRSHAFLSSSKIRLNTISHRL